MPLLTFPKSALGAIVDVALLPDKAGCAYLAQAGLPTPQPVTLKMLVDSGSDVTIVQDAMIAAWCLPYSSFSFGRSMGGPSFAIKTIDLAIEIGGKGTQPWKIDSLPVCTKPNSFASVPYRGMLGIDVLNRGMFIYNGHQHECTIAY